MGTLDPDTILCCISISFCLWQLNLFFSKCQITCQLDAEYEMFLPVYQKKWMPFSAQNDTRSKFSRAFNLSWNITTGRLLSRKSSMWRMYSKHVTLSMCPDSVAPWSALSEPVVLKLLSLDGIEPMQIKNRGNHSQFTDANCHCYMFCDPLYDFICWILRF